MRTRYKVLIVALILLIACLVCGRIAFNKYVTRKYIAPEIEKVSSAVRDKRVQTEINDVINDLRREGYIRDDQISDYLKLAERLGLQTELEAEPGTGEGGLQKPADEPEEENPPAENSNVSGKKDRATWQEDYRGEENNSAPAKTQNPARTKEPQEEPFENEEPAENKDPVKDKNQSLEERVLAAMTVSEAAFAKRMQSKIDVSKAVNLMNSDEEAFKEYIKSVLTSDEISQCISLYAKYAYLIQEEQ